MARTILGGDLWQSKTFATKLYLINMCKDHWLSRTLFKMYMFNLSTIDFDSAQLTVD